MPRNITRDIVGGNHLDLSGFAGKLYDLSGNGNHGTAVGTATFVNTTRPGQFSSGKSMSLDGNSDYFQMDSGVATVASLTSGSVSIWFKTSASGVSQALLSVADKGDPESTWTLRIDTANKLSLYIIQAAFLINASTTATYNDGLWHHVVVTVGSSGNVMYVDGSPVTLTYGTGSAATQAFFGAISDLDAWRIGNNEKSTGDRFWFNGNLYLPRIYSDVLTAAEVTYLNTNGTSGSDPGTANLVFYAIDDTPLIENAESGAPAGTKSMLFDGVNDGLSAGDVLDMGTSDWTCSAWFRTTSTGLRGIFGKQDSGGDHRWGVHFNSSSQLQAIFDPDSPTNSITINAGAGFNNGAWHHVAATYDRDGNMVLYVNGSSAASASISAHSAVNCNGSALLYVGQYGSSNFLFGRIRDCRVYNRALSASEVSDIYNHTDVDDGLIFHAPLGAINNKVEHRIGTYADELRDSVGGQNAVLTNFPADPNTRWQPGVVPPQFDGEGASLAFQAATSEYAVTPVDGVPNLENDSGETLCAWIKVATAPASRQTAVSLNEFTTFSNQLSALAVLSSGKASINRSGQTVDGTSNVADNEWHHICLRAVNSPLSIRIYVDGVQENSGTVGAARNSPSEFYFGQSGIAADPRHFTGSITEVRHYRRALSDAEIATVAAGDLNVTVSANLAYHWRFRDYHHYATITAWLADSDGTPFAAGDIQTGLLADETFSEQCLIDGGGTLGLDRIELLADPTTAFDGSEGSGPLIQNNTGTGAGTIEIATSVPVVIGDGIEISGQATAAQHGITLETGHGRVDIRRVLIHDCDYGVKRDAGTSDVYIHNSVIHEVAEGAILGQAADTDQYIVYHVTAVKDADSDVANAKYGIRYALARNCIAMHFGGSSGATDYADLAAGSSNNISSDSSGNITVVAAALLFTSIAAGLEDYTPLQSSSAIDAGADLLVTGVPLIGKDLKGFMRPSRFDIGAVELSQFPAPFYNKFVTASQLSSPIGGRLGFPIMQK